MAIPGPKPNLDLQMLGLRYGDIMQGPDGSEEECMFVRHMPNGDQVLHRGELKSLSLAMTDAGVYYATPADWWTYEGETLQTRRERFEKYHRRPGS